MVTKRSGATEDIVLGILNARAATWSELRRQLPDIALGHLREILYQVDQAAEQERTVCLTQLRDAALERDGLHARVATVVSRCHPPDDMGPVDRRQLGAIRDAARLLLGCDGYIEPSQVEHLERWVGLLLPDP